MWGTSLNSWKVSVGVEEMHCQSYEQIANHMLGVGHHREVVLIVGVVLFVFID